VTKLALKGLSKSYGQVAAVREVELALVPGEFVSLLGPSGCGKTTTLRMIAGFIRPSAGTIEMDGAVISSPTAIVAPEHRRMSMIFQSYAIWPHMTVAENVAFGLKLRKLGSAEIAAKVGRILDIVQLAHLRDRYPAELSGGQQQRVALARAIVISPEILLLDEPLSNLDANLREEMRFEIRRLHNEFGITTVYVTHDQGEAMVTSDRIVVMSQGRIEQVDDPFTLYNRPRTRFVAGFIGRTNLVEGDVSGGEIAFDGFGLPAGLLPEAAALRGPVTLSIRPQAIRLDAGEGAAGEGHWRISGRIVERAYLGEHWDYTVRVGTGASRLRVTAPPAVRLDVNAPVEVEIDPALVAVVKG
jgi:ABC-type Fe3+/spermidine/putrescine transport system ATPase subunit